MLLLRIKQVNTMLFHFLFSFFRLYWHKVLSRRQTFICDINVNWFNFLIFAKSHADYALYGRGWVGDKTYIKAFTTLWFWRLEILRKFHASQGQSNVNVLRGYVIYTCLTLPYSHWCILLSPVCKVWRCDGHIYTYRRGASALLVSTTMGNAKASNREASDSAGLHAFFMSSS